MDQENFYDVIKKPRKAFIFIHDTYSLRGYVFIIIKLLSCNNVWIYLFKDTDVLLHTNKFISIYSAFVNLNLLFFKTLKYLLTLVVIGRIIINIIVGRKLANMQ